MYKLAEYDKLALLEADCKLILPNLPPNSIDSVVTDPPYELSFMGKKWDGTGIAYDVDMWKSMLNVLKPGGHLLAFGGTRTHHRMMVAIEDAGFQIRDVLMWVYGSGFPKSLDIGKAIDKVKGAEREVVGYDEDYARRNKNGKYGLSVSHNDNMQVRPAEKAITVPATEKAKQWDGWGTALKPAYEPIVLAMKPIEGTFANNVLEWGVGGINIDGCRIGTEKRFNASAGNTPGGNSLNMSVVGMPQDAEGRAAEGRWPANLIHDGSDEVVELFPEVKGEIGRVGRKNAGNYNATSFKVGVVTKTGLRDSGSAARFFYSAKTSKSERNLGCNSIFWERTKDGHILITEDEYNVLDNKDRAQGNIHPTVKPLSLMQYLIRLVTPPDGVVLDPFSGSGTTMLAAYKEGFGCLALEQDSTSNIIAKARWEGREKLKK